MPRLQRRSAISRCPRAWGRRCPLAVARRDTPHIRATAPVLHPNWHPERPPRPPSKPAPTPNRAPTRALRTWSQHTAAGLPQSCMKIAQNAGACFRVFSDGARTVRPGANQQIMTEEFMVNSHRAAAAAVALALLPGCAATAPSYLSPGSTGLQSISRTSAPATGRVLYIADIDGQPGVGQIHVYQATMQKPQWIRDITSGTGRPFGMWVDDRNYLYVANITNKYPAAVTIFKPGASTPFYTISKLEGQPEAVAVDAAHNVYVNENVADAGIVEVFPPNSNTPVREINTGISGYA